jgi:uncharacterized protein (DUF2147 family)
MQKTFSTAVIATLMLSSQMMPAPALAADPAGIWMSGDGGTKVRITNCGDSLCGSVVWLKEPIDKATGKPKTDKYNPDEARKTRPMLGLQVIHGMKPNGSGKWSGQIYNADDGKTYRSNLMLESPTKARVEGCVLIICIGENWTRVAER